MHNKYLGEAVHTKVFGKIIHAFTLRALVAALIHSFGFYKRFNAGSHIYLASHAYCCAWYRHAQVHEIIKGIGFVMTLVTLKAVHQLPGKQVSDYGIVSLNVVLPPVLALFLYW